MAKTVHPKAPHAHSGVPPKPEPVTVKAWKNPLDKVLDWLEGELSHEAHLQAKAMAHDQPALVKHLESHLPPHSMHHVQKHLGLDL